MSNATCLFEGSTNERLWPASAESFWTSLFGLFALHIGAGATPLAALTIWHGTNGTDGKWYVPRTPQPRLQLRNLGFDSIAIEPTGINKPWPGTGLVLSARDGGFSPDVLIRSRESNGTDHFAVVEDKVTSKACLADNQMENYPRLAACLAANGISFDILFLQSAGCCDALHQQALTFQEAPWGNHFGIILWEEVLRMMVATGFPAGVPLDAWQAYTSVLDSVCAGCAA